MTTITSLLLVLTLTGSPVLGIVCHAECVGDQMPVGHCHDDAMTAPAPMVSAGFDCSSPAVGDAPLPFMTPSPVRTGAPAVQPATADSRRTPSLVLRI